jgi:hypothetical protein
VGMARTLSELRGAWAAAVLPGPEELDRTATVVGASTSRFIELLSRDALSKRYIERYFLPVPSWTTTYQLDPDRQETFAAHARDLYAGVADLFPYMPDTLYLASGFWRTNYLPLVQPWRTIYRARNNEERARVALTRFLALLLDIGAPLDLALIFQRTWQLDEHGEYRLRVLPNSLLIRLLVHATQINIRWQTDQIGGDVALPVLKAHCEAMHAITCELDQPDWNQDERDPETGEPLYLSHPRQCRPPHRSVDHRIRLAAAQAAQRQPAPRPSGGRVWLGGRSVPRRTGADRRRAAAHAVVYPDAGGGRPARQVPFLGAHSLGQRERAQPVGDEHQLRQGAPGRGDRRGGASRIPPLRDRRTPR